MGIPNNTKLKRRPTHPVEILRGRRALSPELALRLSRLFGNTPEFWLNLQRAVDLWDAEEAIRADEKHMKPLKVA